MVAGVADTAMSLVPSTDEETSLQSLDEIVCDQVAPVDVDK